MIQKAAIYLAGNIKKGHEKPGEFFWTDTEMGLIRQALQGVEVTFLNPAHRSDDLSDQDSVFGRDMMQVFCSDLVFVDARDRRGLGVGAEMMWAKLHHRPVLTWAPLDTHYRQTEAEILGVPVYDYVHPFVAGLSDKVAGSIEEGAAWIKKLLDGTVPKIKGIESIESAMRHYSASQLEKDLPMWSLFSSDSRVRDRISIFR